MIASFRAENIPEATFQVPGILTIGPNFLLLVAVDASVTLAGQLKSEVKIAKWEVQQTYLQQSADYQPQSLQDAADRDGTQVLGQPTFDYSVTADRSTTAHLKCLCF